MIPKHYIALSEFPVTAQGEVDRDALCKSAMSGQENDHFLSANKPETFNVAAQDESVQNVVVI